MRCALVLLWLGLSAGALPAADPLVTVTATHRQASAVPVQEGFTHTGAGNILVQQASVDVLTFTMTGVAVAGAHPAKHSSATLTFDLTQQIEVQCANRASKAVKLTLEARLIGLLRSHKGGGTAAITCPAQATLNACGGPALLHVELPCRSVSAGENLSVNDQFGPIAVVACPGKYTLHQRLALQATHPRTIFPCKTASAEFAPDPGLDPLWISAFEPFRGAQKKEFGFQVQLRVAPCDVEPVTGSPDNGTR